MNTSAEGSSLARHFAGAGSDARHDPAALRLKLGGLDPVVIKDDRVAADDPRRRRAIPDLREACDSGLSARRGQHVGRRPDNGDDSIIAPCLAITRVRARAVPGIDEIRLARGTDVGNRVGRRMPVS